MPDAARPMYGSNICHACAFKELCRLESARLESALCEMGIRLQARMYSVINAVAATRAFVAQELGREFDVGQRPSPTFSPAHQRPSDLLMMGYTNISA